MREAVINVGYSFLRRRRKAKKRGEGREREERGVSRGESSGALRDATIRENSSIQTWISNGCPEILLRATICLHRCVRGTEKQEEALCPWFWSKDKPCSNGQAMMGKLLIRAKTKTKSYSLMQQSTNSRLVRVDGQPSLVHAPRLKAGAASALSRTMGDLNDVNN